jgi:hypothetical protein|tara:strand:- start:3883 stop:4179 length:297 start_codon:yes stop_codon:yes gene_type:complete
VGHDELFGVADWPGPCLDGPCRTDCCSIGAVKGYAPDWRVRHRKCGESVDAASRGHVRVTARSLKKFYLGRCGACGEFGWLILERDPNWRFTPGPPDR